LILARCTQAVGASKVTGVASAMIFLTFPSEERGRAMGYLVATVAVGSMAGPVVGGVITDLFGWNFIFLVNVPIGIVLLVLAGKYLRLPEIKDPQLHMDWPGALLWIGSIVASLLCLTEAVKTTEPSLVFVILLALSIISLILLIFRELNCKRPLLDPILFRNGLFVFAILSMVLYNVATTMMSIVNPFFLQLVMGFSVSESGLLILVVPVTTAIAAVIGGIYYDKNHWSGHASVGAGTVALGLILLSIAYWMKDLPFILIAFSLMGVGAGLFGGANSTETMSAAPKEKIALASSIYSSVGSMAMAFGTAMASIFMEFEMAIHGYHGNILSATQSDLSRTLSATTMIAAIICVGAVMSSYLRNRNIS
jgi:MFS family permease